MKNSFVFIKKLMGLSLKLPYTVLHLQISVIK